MYSQESAYFIYEPIHESEVNLQQFKLIQVT